MSIICLSKFNYQIHLPYFTSEPFLKSILEMIPNDLGAAVIKSSKGVCIDLCAHSIEHLSEYKADFDYNDIICIMQNLNKQHDFLRKKYSCGFFIIDLKDIIVIDNSTFICINSNLTKPINLNGDFVFYSPFSRSSNGSFISPELITMNIIPSFASSKCFYYSLGALGISCLFKKKIEGLEIYEIEKILKPIYQTKLYWSLLKSTHVDCDKRTLLYI
jgi:hypothetical protein